MEEMEGGLCLPHVTSVLFSPSAAVVGPRRTFDVRVARVRVCERMTPAMRGGARGWVSGGRSVEGRRQASR